MDGTDESRPKRWIRVEGTQYQKDTGAYYISSSIRMGKNISLIEISELVPHLVMNFEVAAHVLSDLCFVRLID
ncbi:hypothetical protein DM02DRAFT_664569 [Periconia macrospinosa]|uniref:Uncharacterized protein n=1 Tax=Periconia macrospinosa TaxID=97972 RepID=A0A2V1CYT4_9PLEO|nr:hypothetical protein DM02DRAFT_664569 [Periconia macrospinosa]